MPTFGSLFAGIGGIDLGLERAGWQCRWQVEWDEWCRRVLAKHWPDVPRYGDITAIDWTGVERVDLLAGGFPCQPFSTAGRRRGKADKRWLWPEFHRAIRALRPRLVLVENVAGFLGPHGGIGAVLGDLAESGYDAEWDCIPASAVGAPHRRDRVWIVAHAVRYGRDDGRGSEGHPDGDMGIRGAPRGTQSGPEHRRPSLADAPGRELGTAESQDMASPGWRTAESRERRRLGRPPERRWPAEPDVGRVADGVPGRVDRLRGLGNAVVPQVAEFIGARLMDASR